MANSFALTSCQCLFVGINARIDTITRKSPVEVDKVGTQRNSWQRECRQACKNDVEIKQHRRQRRGIAFSSRTRSKSKMNDDVLRRLRADLNELRITTLQILHQVEDRK